MGYICHLCGELHDGLPALSVDKPDQYWNVADEERDWRITFSPDTCEIDGEHFFIRGNLEIPILASGETLCFGVWVSQKEENFRTYLENFESPDIGPFFGWLCTRIKHYDEEPLLLKTMAYFLGGGLRPAIEVHESETHQLAIDQREGITLERAWEIAHFYMDQGPAD